MEQEINGKVQKINDEDYEIIKKLESTGYKKAVEWYKENYDCELDEAKETVKAIWAKYKVSYPGSDLDEIREMLESAKSVLGAEKLYKERYNVSADEAKRKVLDAVSKFNAENNGGKSSSGCMVTILIAITSTLSVLCLL